VAAGFLAEGANVVVVDLVEPPETLRGPRFEAVVGDVADERTPSGRSGRRSAASERSTSS
jgi:hypothetical protein